MFYQWGGFKQVWLKPVTSCIIKVIFIHARFCKMYNMQILYLVEHEIKMMLLFIEENLHSKCGCFDKRKGSLCLIFLIYFHKNGLVG